MTCNNCGKPIAKGKWCSDKCRKAYARNSDIQPGQNSENVRLNPDKTQLGHVETDNSDKNEWFNSAETKTQAEIEEHYTLRNFPRVKYGTGTGSYSPYPMKDPRSVAYRLD